MDFGILCQSTASDLGADSAPPPAEEEHNRSALSVASVDLIQPRSNQIQPNPCLQPTQTGQAQGGGGDRLAQVGNNAHLRAPRGMKFQRTEGF